MSKTSQCTHAAVYKPSPGIYMQCLYNWSHSAVNTTFHFIQESIHPIHFIIGIHRIFWEYKPDIDHPAEFNFWAETTPHFKHLFPWWPFIMFVWLSDEQRKQPRERERERKINCTHTQWGAGLLTNPMKPGSRCYWLAVMIIYIITICRNGVNSWRCIRL